MYIHRNIPSDCDAMGFPVASDFVVSNRHQADWIFPTGGSHNIRPNLKTEFLDFPKNSFNPAFYKAQSDKGIFCFLDWMRFNGEATESQWRALVMLIFPGRDESFWVNREENFKPYPGHRGYPHALKGEKGSRLAWRSDVDENGVKTRLWDLTMPGKALEGMGFEQIIRLLERLSAIFPDLNPTRFDFTVEDHSKSLPIDELTNALNAKNYRGFLKKAVILSDTTGQGWDGFTANLGSRESDSYTRIYETTIKHGYPAIRVEREVKGALLKAYWQELKQIIYDNRWTIKGDCLKIKPAYEIFYNGLIQRFAAIAVSGLDFIDRSQILDSGSLQKCPLLPFWENFKSKMGEWKMTVKRPIPTLKTTHDWLYRQVKKTIAVLKHGLTEMDFIEVIDRFVNHGKQDFTKKDKMDISILQDKGLFAFMGIKTIESEYEVVHEPILLDDELLGLVPY